MPRLKSQKTPPACVIDPTFAQSISTPRERRRSEEKQELLCYNAHTVCLAEKLAHMSLNWADWIIIAVIGVSSVVSLLRGFVKEALSLVSWAAASFVAIAFHERLAMIFSRWIDSPSARTVLAFAALFLLTLLIGALINWLLHQFVIGAGLSAADRFLGMVFGLARGLLVVLALVITLPMVLPQMKQDVWWHKSRLLPYFETGEGWAHGTFSEVLGWSQSLAERARTAQERMR